MRILKALITTLLLLCLGSLPILAEESQKDRHENTLERRQHVALFLGGTHADDEDAFTVGLDYEYLFHEMFGVGGLIDDAGGDLGTTLIAPALFVHPFGGFAIVLAPGIEFNDDDNFAFRLGFSYEFEFNERFTVAPEINFDFVDGEVDEVYGLAFGIKF